MAKSHKPHEPRPVYQPARTWVIDETGVVTPVHTNQDGRPQASSRIKAVTNALQEPDKS